MNFDQLKGIFASTFGTVTEKGKEYADIAVDTAKSAGRFAKVRFDLAGEKESLKKSYAEIGKLYYETCRGSAEGVFAALCEETEAISNRIAAMEAELAELKESMTVTREEDVEVSFEEVVEADEKAAEECTEAPAEEPKCCCEEKAEEPKTEE